MTTSHTESSRALGVHGRTILCTICARGGSKGVPQKNLRPLNGKPLILHTIEQALQLPFFADVVVSTDSAVIADVCRAAGAKVPFLRPAELARDDSPKLPVIRHALEWMEADRGAPYDLVVDLDPTAPMRSLDDIRGSLELFATSGASVVLSVFEAKKNPYFNMVELDADGWAFLSKTPAIPVSRRQATPKVYALNASIYVIDRQVLLVQDTLFTKRTAVWLMPEERSIDIDSELDFLIVEHLMQHGQSAHLHATGPV